MLGGQLGALLESRCEVVASLVGEIAEATRAHGVRFELLDSSGAVKGYATGRPAGDAAPSIGWRLGTDVAACARAGAAVGAIAYAAEPARVALDLAAYRALAPAAPLVAAMRPVPPDCDSAENLAEKLRAPARRASTASTCTTTGWRR